MVALRSLIQLAPVLFLFGDAVCAIPLRPDRRLSAKLAVEVDQLGTYFEEFDVDILNALDDAAGLPDVEVKARVQRLNHYPFGIKITTSSGSQGVDESTKARLVTQTSNFLSNMAKLCPALGNGPLAQALGPDLATADDNLVVTIFGISGFTGVSEANLAPEIATNPESLARCFPKTAHTISGLSN